MVCMKNSELLKVWALPDNSRVTSKQLSFRFPVHVAAKISALSDLFEPSQLNEQTPPRYCCSKLLHNQLG